MNQLLSFVSTLKYIGYIFIAILILLLMVLIHELGHYIAGKILKFKINEFSVGFGPKLLQKTKKNGEKISLRLFPLGGYCAFEGENEDGTDNPEAFNNQKPWKRLIVLFSGAFFNFLSAIIFSFILLLCNGYDLVQVKNINNTSINYEQLQTGDVIYGIDGVKIDFVKDNSFNLLITSEIKENYNKYGGDLSSLSSFVEEEKTFYISTQPLVYNVKRDGDKIEVQGYINVIYNDKGEYSGWTMLTSNQENPTEFDIGTYKYGFGESLVQCVPFTCRWAWKVLIIFGQLLTGQLGLETLGGPITTIDMIASGVSQSASFILLLLPLIAVNLAVFNLLPIPALDGFQMVFVTIEWIRKKPIKREIINLINNIGLFVLLGFVLVVDGFQIFTKIFK